MGHFYDREGKPVYYIKGANGVERDTTLRDAKKHGFYPSVTTIIASIAKPGLVKWQIEQALWVAIQTKRKPSESDESFLKRILGQYHGDSKKITEKGSLIHDKLETYYKENMMDFDLYKWLVPAINLIQESFENVMWISEASFGHVDGYGGKVDMHSLHGEGIVLDFKTKDTEDLSDIVMYDDYALQLAAYRKGLDIPKAKCYNLFISTRDSTVPPRLELWDEEKIHAGEKMFYSLLNYYKLSNKFMTETV